MNIKDLNTLSTICADIMRCDQHRLQKRLRTLQSKIKKGQTFENHVFEQLFAEIEKSLKQRQRRFANLPKPLFPDDLPVSNRREDIAAAIAANQVVIIAGETGSGKTTQLPKICLSLERGISGMIGCTQPRRIAARTIAMRVSNELESQLGHVVGYKVRFSDRLSNDTYIKFMTDGILLAETQGDRFLEAYDTLIIDEAHERSLNIDFLLGYIKQLLPKRPDLKLIITSATIDTQRFSAHFDNAPIVEVSGRTYPIETRYHPLVAEGEEEEDRDVIQGILKAVDDITLYDRQADMLVFLASERDIRETAEALRKHRLFNTEILPLYARLSAAEQNRVFSLSNQRRIILATNVAETSLTVPNIKAVIDPGLARISRYSIRNKVQRLPIENISRSSADQRKGRCGRIAPGLCIRLYSSEDYDQRPEFTVPEILRTSLASVILRMLSLRLGDINHFPFVEPPTQSMINDGFTLLTELGAVHENRQLTNIGWQLSKWPIDPRIGRMILAAKTTCLHEVLIIASALSIQDPRERPMDAQQAADTAQKLFIDEKSDFLSYLKLWDFFQENAKHLSQRKLRKLCHEHFLSYMRMREWQDIHKQLYTLIREMGWKVNKTEVGFDEIHRALLAGLLGNVAFKTEMNKKSEPKNISKKFSPEEYLGARNIKAYLFPGSSLFKKQPKWIMAAELVETTRLYARCCAKINPDWIEQVAGDLCQHHYFEPHWEKSRAQVGAYEKVTLYGLTIVAKRKVNYGPLDPKLSKEIFIRHALVQGEYDCKADFFEHNHQLVHEVESLEHKSRRQDILVDEEQIYAFYDARIKADIYSGKDFEKWRKKAESKTPKLLFLSREDLMKHAGDSVTPHAFPDNLLINDVSLPLHYHFEPGHKHDGVTVDLPIALLNQITEITAVRFEWLVPGLLEEKIIGLLRSLPKTLRKSFVPVPDVARDALDTIKMPVVTFRESGSFLEYPKESLIDALTTYCHRRLGKPLPTDCWQTDTLSPHLFMKFRLIESASNPPQAFPEIDEKEQEGILDISRDLTALQQKWGHHATKNAQQQIADKSGLERDNITVWDFGDLANQVTLKLDDMAVQGFPTLIDQETHVALRVLDNPTTAEAEFMNGLRRLFLLALPTKKLLRQMPIDTKLCLQYMKIGNCEQLKQDMLTVIIDSIFLATPLPKKQADFDERLLKGKQRLMPAAYEYATQLAKVLEEYHTLTQQVQKLSNRSTALSDIKQHLKHLVYNNFVKDIPLSQLKHLPRYLKAVQLRLARLDLDPQKDAKKANQLAPLWKAYWQHHTDNIVLNPKLIEFRWMLEELRVSLFAQELKTAYPVSVQRLQKVWGQLPH